MLDLGVVRPGQTIIIPFSTFDKDDGSSITMTNFAAADILVYKDGSTTERASTAGYTATTDFDGKTGKHVVVIDLADDTTADFWACGSEYLVAIDAVTVDAVTTGGWVARFRIGYRAAVINTTIATLASQTSFTLTAGPAEDDALNGMWCLIHDKASAVQCGWALILDYTGSTKTVTLVAGTTFTVAAKDNISIMFPAPLQPTVLGRTLDVTTTGEAGIDWANIGGPTTTVNLSGTTVKTATDVETDTADIQTRLPAALVSGRIDASVGAMASAVLTATAIASDAITAAKIAADAIGASELAADAVAEIADAVWDEVLSGHLTAGSTGNALNAAGSAGDPWSTTLPGSYTGSQAGKMLSDILTDTAEIGTAGAGLTALASAANLATLTGYVDTEVATIVTQTSAASIRTALGLASANLDTQLATIDTVVDKILDDTGTSGVIVASLADGSITSAVIATGAIDADALAADAATEIATAVLTTQMTESYAADGTAPTLAQAMFLTQQSLHEFAISGTTRTVKKLDGTTTAATFTLDSATAATSTTRAS